jgi:hypothetical protein
MENISESTDQNMFLVYLISCFELERPYHF